MCELVNFNEQERKIEVSNDLINEIKNFEALKVHMELQEKKLKEELLETMKKYNINNYESIDGTIKAYYKMATVRKNIDSKKLKEEMPEIADKYSKVINVKESVQLLIEV